MSWSRLKSVLGGMRFRPKGGIPANVQGKVTIKGYRPDGSPLTKPSLGKRRRTRRRQRHEQRESRRRNRG